MKAKVLNLNAEVEKEIELPKIFNEEVREDLIRKVFEIYRFNSKSVYGSYVLAGKEVSASGKIRHRRRKYKGSYGRGISRIPRKILTRRGSSFYWLGAFIPGTVKGRRAHPPKPLRKRKKINKREIKKTLASAIASTSKIEFLSKRYETLKDKKINIKFPIVVSSEICKIKKTKKIFEILKKILNDIINLAIPKKKIRAGKGKLRGRRYKKTRGLLFVIANNESMKGKNLGIEIVKVKDLNIEKIAPGGVPGRLTIYTEKAIEDLKNLK